MTTGLLAGFEAYCRARAEREPLAGLDLYKRAKLGPVSTLSITPTDLALLRQWLRPDEVFVVEDFGRQVRICSPNEASLGKPANPTNCPNCGAHRVAASRACDYCGSAA